MSTILRQAASIARQTASKRAFASSAVSRKDLVQDLYVREIKSYKAPPAAKDAHVGIVKKLAIPAAPTAPALPADLASELNAYDAAEPALAESSSTAQATKTEDTASGADAFLSFLEQDLPKPVAHH
ncbi:hypothetical protein GALMADRAFT_227742 [Galerina marginata CBS 339.88]|uniref:ATP synthase complex subunit H n=1 Tax=Galerina marginata (strain CBS 339.88) TaxID=685588 RepID=A0A067ST40_GALM3|nr:hypothetical protein GALMADRAFT_227742 [Galerina marginata CBS 339.88]